MSSTRSWSGVGLSPPGRFVADGVGVFPVRVDVAAGQLGADFGVVAAGLCHLAAAAARGGGRAIHVEAGRRPRHASSTSRSLRRARSSPGARRVPPAPAAVPVERFVGIGLVRPLTDRPVSGVCARVALAAGASAPCVSSAPGGCSSFSGCVEPPAGLGPSRRRCASSCLAGVFAPAVLRPVLRRGVDPRRAPASASGSCPRSRSRSACAGTSSCGPFSLALAGFLGHRLLTPVLDDGRGDPAH